MKKKIISALLAAVMVFSLTACGGGSDKKSADGTYYNTYLDMQYNPEIHCRRS